MLASITALPVIIVACIDPPINSLSHSSIPAEIVLGTDDFSGSSSIFSFSKRQWLNLDISLLQYWTTSVMTLDTSSLTLSSISASGHRREQEIVCRCKKCIDTDWQVSLCLFLKRRSRTWFIAWRYTVVLTEAFFFPSLRISTVAAASSRIYHEVVMALMITVFKTSCTYGACRVLFTGSATIGNLAPAPYSPCVRI